MRINRKNLLFKIIVFLGIFLIGLFFYVSTFSNYQVSSSITTGILAGKYPIQNEKMNVDYFLIDMNTQKQIVYLTFELTYFDTGNYSVLLTLPYKISTYEILEGGTWIIKNANSGSIVFATFEAENLTTYGWGSQRLRVKLSLQDPIVDNIFETNSVYLPFGGSITIDIQEKLDEIRENYPIAIIGNGFNGTLRLTLPYSAIISSTTLEVDRRDPGTDFEVLQFQINDFKPFQLQYLDSEQRNNFERNILISGTLFGVATAGFAEIVIGLMNTKNKNNGENEKNIEEPEIKELKKNKKESFEDQILLLIRLIDSKKTEIFKDFDFFRGATTFSFTIILILLFLTQLFLFILSASPIEKMSIAIAFSAFTLGFFSIVFRIADQNILNVNYKRLEKSVEENNRPILKALLKLKMKNPKFDLEQIYNGNNSMFTQEELLEELYD